MPIPFRLAAGFLLLGLVAACAPRAEPIILEADTSVSPEPTFTGKTN